MPKRAATSELNYFNWNQEEEEPEEECTAPKIASPEVLSNRVIRTAKRFTSSSSPATGKSAFSNFAGFGNTSNTKNNDVKTTFSFLSKANSSSFSNTNGISTQKTEQTEKEDAQESSKKNVNTDNDYLSKLKGLNETVLEWIKIHVGKNPTCILTPIFNDYEKYLKEIQNEKQTKKVEEKTEQPVSSTTSLQTSSSKPYFTNSLFTTSNNESKDSTIKPKLVTLTKESSNTSLIPGLNPISNSLNSKGENKTSIIFTTAPVGSSSSGDTKMPSLFGSSPFSSGNLAPSTSVTTSNSEDNENEEDEPPKNVFERVKENDAVFSQRIKLFLKKEDTFVDNGVGTLYIRPVDEEGTKYQAIVRADTNLGNILLNIILKDSIPSKRVGKNNVMIVCVLEVSKKMKPVPVLLRVKTETEADNLLEEINKYKK
uniref:Putative nucleoporin 50 kDa n=1 Tax=Rhodnius prolixus TaxID=13249 RepID=R4G8G1_RHOPR